MSQLLTGILNNFWNSLSATSMGALPMWECSTRHLEGGREGGREGGKRKGKVIKTWVICNWPKKECISLLLPLLISPYIDHTQLSYALAWLTLTRPCWIRCWSPRETLQSFSYSDLFDGQRNQQDCLQEDISVLDTEFPWWVSCGYRDIMW